VRLRGPTERRIHQAMALLGIDREAAERALHSLDRAHSAYVRHFYGVSIDDPAHYDVVIDSTRLPIDDCLELLAIAARAIRLSDGPAGSDLLDPVRHRREGDGSSYR
jgi:cytidylate kinase